MANTHIRFDNDIDDYEPSESEDDYDPKEKALLNKVRKKFQENSDSEEEVYGLNAENSSSDDENEIADSDIDKADDDDLPDIRAWGKHKRNFYETDYIDQDFGGFQGKDATEAEFEENEARDIQKRLAEQLDDEDFSLDIFNQVKQNQQVFENTEIIKSDLSSLSKRELKQLLEKESPEMFMLIEDCKIKMERVKQFLYPLIQKVKMGQIEDCEAINFVKVLYNMTLNYSVNVCMYLLLRASKINVQIHPVLRKLYQYRQLTAQLEPIYEEIILPQIEIILNAETEKVETIKEKSEIVKNVKKLKLLQKLETPEINIEKVNKLTDIQKSPAKKLKSDKSVSKIKNQVTFELKETDEIIENEEKSDVEEENKDEVIEDLQDPKRPITYQMQKNKGLTPYRKKEQRNPRVKHRNKFRKANIRRKGAIREVRKELSRYGGEISGIKASVSKSIKIK